MRAERREFATNNWRRNDIVQYNKQIAEAKTRRGQESLQIVKTAMRGRLLMGILEHK